MASNSMIAPSVMMSMTFGGGWRWGDEDRGG